VARKLAFLVVGIFAVGLIVYLKPDSGRLPHNVQIDHILIEKSQRELSIFRSGKRLKTYRVALGRNPIGPKQQEGDMKTPEGIYRVDGRNEHSDFHLALHISYPSAEDSARAASHGESPGSDIEIHGLASGMESLGAFHREKDWTAGCIALTNQEIEELWRVTPDGTVVEIRP
jgi:murein L,D-transpeptidase YafK